MIRTICEKDIDEIHQIWERYYQLQFPFPNFLNYICAFVVTDNNDRIITAGGVRTIAELLVVTDISAGLFERNRAWREMLQASKFVALKSGFNNLTCFVNDERWASILTRLKTDKFNEEIVLTLEL